MLTVILTILKILGLVIAGILGLILLILGIVLFVPIRYQAHVVKTNEETDNIDVKAKVTFLLHLLNVHVSYPGDELYKVRIGFIKILPTKKKSSDSDSKTPDDKKEDSKQKDKSKKVKSEKDKNVKDKSEENHQDLENQDSDIVDSGNNDSGNNDSDNNDSDTIDTVIDIAENVTDEISDEFFDDNPTIEKFFNKVFDALRNFKDSIEKVYAKVVDVFENIEYYLNIVTSIHFDRALDHTKKKLGKMLYSMRPRTIKGYLNFGSVEPDTTAMVYGLYTAAHTFIFRDFILNPVFEENVVEGNVLIKGKITVIHILSAGIKIYFNKDVKYLIRKFTKKDTKKDTKKAKTSGKKMK